MGASRGYSYDLIADYAPGNGFDEFRSSGSGGGYGRIGYDSGNSPESAGYYDYPLMPDERRDKYGMDWQATNSRLNDDRTRWYDGSTQQRRGDDRFGSRNYDLQRNNARDGAFYSQASRDDYYYPESNNFGNKYVDDNISGNENQFRQRRENRDSSNRNEQQRFRDISRYEDRDYSTSSRNTRYNNEYSGRGNIDRSYDSYYSQQQRQNNRPYDVRRGDPYNYPQADPFPQDSMMPFMPNNAPFPPLSSIMPSFPALFRNIFSMPFNFDDDISSNVLQRTLQQARDLIADDAKINQLMGNRIQFRRPFSQNVASNTFNGKSSSFAKVSFEIVGMGNRRGVATVEARDGSVNFLVVDLDGERIMVDGRKRRDDVVDAEIID